MNLETQQLAVCCGQSADLAQSADYTQSSDYENDTANLVESAGSLEPADSTLGADEDADVVVTGNLLPATQGLVSNQNQVQGKFITYF